MNYHDMTDAEIDRLLAERFGFSLEGIKLKGHFLILNSKQWCFDGKPLGLDFKFNPIHKSSNQIEEFIWPEVIKRCDATITGFQGFMGYEITINMDLVSVFDGFTIVKESCEDYSQINRTKGICALMAHDKLIKED